MKIGITIWDNRVSPVFDTAEHILIVEYENEHEIFRQEKNIPAMFPYQRVQFVLNSGIEVLICGALSRRLEMALNSSGIRVIPWVKGDIETILPAYFAGELENGNHSLPGCRGRGRRRGFGKGRGRSGRITGR